MEILEDGVFPASLFLEGELGTYQKIFAWRCAEWRICLSPPQRSKTTEKTPWMLMIMEDN